MAGLLIGQTPALAIEAIPEAPGWGALMLVGAGYVELRSNFVSGNGPRPALSPGEDLLVVPGIRARLAF